MCRAAAYAPPTSPEGHSWERGKAVIDPGKLARRAGKVAKPGRKVRSVPNPVALNENEPTALRELATRQRARKSARRQSTAIRVGG